MKTKVILWDDIDSPKARKLLKDFPKCGVRYDTAHGFGLVLVDSALKDQVLIAKKRDASKIKSNGYTFICEVQIPKEEARV